MDAPFIGHFLIGAPGSGKSTFAGRLATLGNCQIVSTDTIRYELYGDESIQGDWAAIEGRAVSQIREGSVPRLPQPRFVIRTETLAGFAGIP